MLLWNHAGADPIKAAEALIKLEAREARLLGLDMPTKVAVTDPDGGIPLETIRRVMERVDRQMVDVTPEPASLPLDHKRRPVGPTEGQTDPMRRAGRAAFLVCRKKVGTEWALPPI